MFLLQISSLILLGLVRGSVGATLADPFTASGNTWSDQTSITTKGSPGFFEATERWDLYRAPEYSVAISPATEADVVTAIKAAQELNIPFLATGGRHGYSNTLGEMQGGVAIDLSKLNSIKVDKKAATLTVGPGVHFGEVFDPLYKAGLQIQTGTATCPGMIGVTLGAGIGRLNGLQGLVIDALVSARIVLANGTLLEVSKTKNSDLFWAIRGAGQNFGVVTSATYQASPLYKGGEWTSVDVIVPLEKNVTYFETVSKMMPLPADLTVQTTIGYGADAKTAQLLVSLVYAGPKDSGLKAMAPILDLGPFPFKNVSSLAWNTVGTNSMFQSDAAVCGNSQVFDLFGFNLKTFNAKTWSATLAKFVDFYDKNPSARDSAVLLESWPNQAVSKVPDDDTAYPWRDATTYGLLMFRWKNLGDPVEAVANKLGLQLRNDIGATSGYGGVSVYVNYARGDETLEQIYGAKKLPKLAKLKAKYDPKNAFKYYHALPTSYP